MKREHIRALVAALDRAIAGNDLNEVRRVRDALAEGSHYHVPNNKYAQPRLMAQARTGVSR